MADGQAKESSDIIDNNFLTCWNFNKINEHIKSKSITYDGIRVKWCDNYDSLKVSNLLFVNKENGGLREANQEGLMLLLPSSESYGILVSIIP